MSGGVSGCAVHRLAVVLARLPRIATAIGPVSFGDQPVGPLRRIRGGARLTPREEEILEQSPQHDRNGGASRGPAPVIPELASVAGPSRRDSHLATPSHHFFHISRYAASRPRAKPLSSITGDSRIIRRSDLRREPDRRENTRRAP